MRRHWPILAGLAILVAACASPAGPARPQTGSAPQSAPTESRTLNVAVRVEPAEMLSAPEDRGVLHKALFTATLALWDGRGEPLPLLAERVSWGYGIIVLRSWGYAT